MRVSILSFLFIMIMIAMLPAGCSTVQQQPTPWPSRTQTFVPTMTATIFVPTITDTPEPLPTNTPTLHPIGTMSAIVTVNNLNLRAGPGTIYAILNVYPVGTELFVTSRMPGNEWVRVLMPDGKTGWMSTDLLALGEGTAYLPLEDVTDSIMVTGRVIDSSGKPVDKVTIAVMQRSTSITLRTDAISDKDGYWYAYIPKESLGTWEVQLIGVDCESWIYDDSCNIVDHFLYNYRFFFTPPPTSPFLFMYQIAETYITGDVTDADGVPVSMRVYAERSDGAYVYVTSNDAGLFRLPVESGTWNVYSMQYNPTLQGESVTVIVEAGMSPEPVSIKAPIQEE